MGNGVYRPTTMARLPAGTVEYRLERRGEAVVVVFHGGHVRAGLAVGEDVFAAAGCTLLAPSPPGYGRTPLTTGTSVEGFTDVVRALCADLGIIRITAVVGISGGGPTAATMAARHADLVERLILISAVVEDEPVGVRRSRRRADPHTGCGQRLLLRGRRHGLRGPGRSRCRGPRRAWFGRSARGRSIRAIARRGRDARFLPPGQRGSCRNAEPVSEGGCRVRPAGRGQLDKPGGMR